MRATEPHVGAAQSFASAPASDVSTSALAALRTASWPYHQQLEKRLDIKRRFSERAAYAAHLARMWGFCAALERSIDPNCFRFALPDFPQRHKLSLLESDLGALGWSAAAIAQLPVCQGFAVSSDTAQAFGRLYVLEGATLGGRTLLPPVEKHLGCTSRSGAAFLASYGDQVQSMWQRFGSALEAWCAGAERIAQARVAAIDTFEQLELWLCGPQP